MEREGGGESDNGTSNNMNVWTLGGWTPGADLVNTHAASDACVCVCVCIGYECVVARAVQLLTGHSHLGSIATQLGR